MGSLKIVIQSAILNLAEKNAPGKLILHIFMFHFGYQLNITRGMVTAKMRFVQLTANQMMAQNARDDDLQLRNGQGVFMSIGIQL